MTSQSETTNFDVNLVDLLQKQFSEEKRAHGETILKLLTAQAQAQTAEAKAAKAQEEVRSLRAHAQELKDAQANSQESLAQELQEAKDKIASLEAQMAKIQAVVAESEVPEPRDQELRAAQAQMRIFEQFQTQSQELKAARAQVAQTKKELGIWRTQVGAQARELEAAQANIEDLEARAKPKAPVQISARPSRVLIQELRWLENSDCLVASDLNLKSAPWFGPNHLKYFMGQTLRLSHSGLRAEDMVQFLDSWLSGTHPELEMMILDDFESHPSTFDKFAPSLVRDYDNGPYYSSSTFHLKRPSDGRIACVKITWDMFVFVV